MHNSSVMEKFFVHSFTGVFPFNYPQNLSGTFWNVSNFTPIFELIARGLIHLTNFTKPNNIGDLQLQMATNMQQTPYSE